ncbi:zinc ABC transporter substrate-binding protein [Kiritimatiellaeota bacterium B1221]|nr:zinc ABC transporter substrate-binding protein [Kiritimatiellaeota bacterium B1221]
MKNMMMLLLFGLLSLTGKAEEGEKMKVAVTVGMIGDVVANVAGDAAEVVTIIGSDVDPHLYRPTRNDVLKFQQADVIFYNGMMLEGKMGDVLMRMSRRGKPVYPVTEELQEAGGYVLNTDSDHLDPHVWMDVKGWMAAVDVVEKGLSKQDPSRKALFAKNAAAYGEQLKELDAYAGKVLATIPETQRVLVTAHDAFSYMGRAYGLRVKGIQGLSTESEAGVRDIEDLVNFLVEYNIPAVFVESSVADKNVRALVEGAKAKGHQVIIGGELFSDAMGKPGTYEGTYIGMIDHNATLIARALGGEAPAGGMQNKLMDVEKY